MNLRTKLEVIDVSFTNYDESHRRKKRRNDGYEKENKIGDTRGDPRGILCGVDSG